MNHIIMKNVPVIKLNHQPNPDEVIPGLGTVIFEQKLGEHTRTSLVYAKARNNSMYTTVLVDYASSNSTVDFFVSKKKKVYFSILENAPVVGYRLKMYRYATCGSLKRWKQEFVTTGKIISMKKLWDSVFYAESNSSVYYLVVGI